MSTSTCRNIVKFCENLVQINVSLINVKVAGRQCMRMRKKRLMVMMMMKCFIRYVVVGMSSQHQTEFL